MLGDGIMRRMPSEEPNAPLVRRSWHAAVDLAAGTVVGAEDAVALRPEGGVAPSVDLVGRVLAANVSAGRPLTEADLEPLP
jgi:N-acetylneuraminate synthase/N,N'-diacetyllegionaminate synthase